MANPPYSYRPMREFDGAKMHIHLARSMATTLYVVAASALDKKIARQRAQTFANLDYEEKTATLAPVPFVDDFADMYPREAWRERVEWLDLGPAVPSRRRRRTK